MVSNSQAQLLFQVGILYLVDRKEGFYNMYSEWTS